MRDWTDVEDRILIRAIESNGYRWHTVSHAMHGSGRSADTCRQRFIRLKASGAFGGGSLHSTKRATKRGRQSPREDADRDGGRAGFSAGDGRGDGGHVPQEVAGEGGGGGGCSRAEGGGGGEGEGGAGGGKDQNEGGGGGGGRGGNGAEGEEGEEGEWEEGEEGLAMPEGWEAAALEAAKAAAGSAAYDADPSRRAVAFSFAASEALYLASHEINDVRSAARRARQAEMSGEGDAASKAARVEAIDAEGRLARGRMMALEAAARAAIELLSEASEEATQAEEAARERAREDEVRAADRRAARMARRLLAVPNASHPLGGHQGGRASHHHPDGRSNAGGQGRERRMEGAAHGAGAAEEEHEGWRGSTGEDAGGHGQQHEAAAGTDDVAQPNRALELNSGARAAGQLQPTRQSMLAATGDDVAHASGATRAAGAVAGAVTGAVAGAVARAVAGAVTGAVAGAVRVTGAVTGADGGSSSNSAISDGQANSSGATPPLPSTPSLSPPKQQQEEEDNNSSRRGALRCSPWSAANSGARLDAALDNRRDVRLRVGALKWSKQEDSSLSAAVRAVLARPRPLDRALLEMCAVLPGRPLGAIKDRWLELKAAGKLPAPSAEQLGMAVANANLLLLIAENDSEEAREEAAEAEAQLAAAEVAADAAEAAQPAAVEPKEIEMVSGHAPYAHAPPPVGFLPQPMAVEQGASAQNPHGCAPGAPPPPPPAETNRAGGKRERKEDEEPLWQKRLKDLQKRTQRQHEVHTLYKDLCLLPPAPPPLSTAAAPPPSSPPQDDVNGTAQGTEGATAMAPAAGRGDGVSFMGERREREEGRWVERSEKRLPPSSARARGSWPEGGALGRRTSISIEEMTSDRGGARAGRTWHGQLVFN